MFSRNIEFGIFYYIYLTFFAERTFLASGDIFADYCIKENFIRKSRSMQIMEKNVDYENDWNFQNKREEIASPEELEDINIQNVIIN